MKIKLFINALLLRLYVLTQPHDPKPLSSGWRMMFSDIIIELRQFNIVSARPKPSATGYQ
jgi:hypothetical protein